MLPYLEKLNPQQREAATTIHGPLLIIAGAGSGKTTVLISRLAYMIDSGIDAGQILLLTFTNAAANNMKERAAMALSSNTLNITAGTYHSFCATVLRRYSSVLGYEDNFTIITPHETVDAIKLVRTELNLLKIKNFPSNEEIASMLSRSINTDTDLIRILEEYGYQVFASQIESIVDAYTTYKKDRNLMDYDDLLVNMYELLKCDNIATTLSNKYRYIMVDEYQDTNKLQEQIVMRLCCAHNNLAVVGDDYQSIYKFRGSDIRNIIDFPKKMPGCKQIQVTTNYRSYKEIIDVANCVMDNHADFGFKKSMQAHHFNGKKPKIVNVVSTEAEAAYIAQTINEYIENGTYEPQEIAVLSRSSIAMTELELNLNSRQIPFTKYGGLKFLDRECIQDILAMFRIIANKKDELAWYRVLCLVPNIGEVKARILAQKCVEDITSAYLFSMTKIYAKDFESLYNNLLTAQALPWENCCNYLASAYLDLRKNNIEKGRYDDEGNRTKAKAQLEADRVLVEKLQEITLKTESITEFLDKLSLDATEEESENSVTLSTVHSAKGLEWDVVFVMNCVEGVFPKMDECILCDDNYYEELRCFYVAITRAKKEMLLMNPETIEKGHSYIPAVLTHVLEECVKAGYIEFNNPIVEFDAPKKKKQTQGTTIYLRVPFSDKDEVKMLGARWNPKKKMWFYLDTNPNKEKLEKWHK